MSAEQDDPVVYSIHVEHYRTGDIIVTVKDIATDETSKIAVIAALEEALLIVRGGKPTSIDKFN